MTKTEKNWLAFVLITTLVLCMCLAYFATRNNGSSGNTLFSRQATMNDITIDTSAEISLSTNYTINPKVDINDLELTFKYYTNDNKYVTTKSKVVGNVKARQQYQVSISFAEFSFTQLLNISKVSVSVAKGSTATFN